MLPATPIQLPRRRVKNVSPWGTPAISAESGNRVVTSRGCVYACSVGAQQLSFCWVVPGSQNHNKNVQ